MLVIGGGMANTFLLAQGKPVGKSLLEHDRLDDAQARSWPRRRSAGPASPADRRRRRQGGHARRRAQDRSSRRRSRPAGSASTSGKQSLANFEAALADAKTVIWNGPLGVFEVPTFGDGTKQHRAVARREGRGRRDGRRRRRRLDRGRDPAGPRRQDDPHQHRRRRLARVPRGPRAARYRPSSRTASPPGARRDRHDHRLRRRAGDPGLARQPDRRGRGRARRRLGGPGGRAVRGVDRGPRGGRAARRRQGPLRRQGRAAGGLERPRAHRPGADRRGRRGPGGDRPLLLELDGTPNKATLGANAILGVSLACAHAAAAAHDLPLYRYLGGVGARTLPVPMFNILNGGKHAQDSTDFQEFMVMPVGLDSFRRRCGRARRSSPPCAGSCTTRATRPARATRAGSRRRCASNEAAVEVVLQAIERAGYRPGEQIAIALDPATTELVEGGSGGKGPTRYRLAKEGRTLERERWSTSGPTGRRATRSSPSRMASPRTTGLAGSC